MELLLWKKVVWLVLWLLCVWVVVFYDSWLVLCRLDCMV